MPLRRDHIGWSRQELARCAALTAQGYSAEDAAKRLNAEFHDGKVVRGEASIKMVRQKNGRKVGPKPKTPLPDADIPNDIAMTKLMYQTADQYGIKYILNGHDFRTEGSTPASWTYMDAKYIQSVYFKYTGKQLENYPLFTFSDQIKYGLKGIKNIRPFHYIKDRVRMETDMKDLIGWQDYGGKHCENVYTEFVGSYLLPKKFKIDKRIVYLSAQVRSGALNKEQAKEIFAKKPKFDLSKLGQYENKIERLIRYPYMERSDFDRYDFKKYKTIIWLLAKFNVVPYTFYKKYCS